MYSTKVKYIFFLGNLRKTAIKLWMLKQSHSIKGLKCSIHMCVKNILTLFYTDTKNDKLMAEINNKN